MLLLLRLIDYGLRDYGTAKWEGGDPECDHISGLDNPRSGRPLGLFHGGDDKFHTTPYKTTCGKCGAIRIDEQIGLEQTPDAYIANLVAVFREVKRVLKDDGTLWLNLGSSFVSGIIESQEYILRDDLTAEELEYVYSELAKHFEAQSKAVPDLREVHASAEQEMSGLLRPGKGAA